MLRVYLVDDEIEALDALENLLLLCFKDVDVCGKSTTIEDAYNGIIDEEPQLVFLDIEIGRDSGFDLLKKFNEVHFQVAFVTAHEEYALQAIKFSALDYIIKPASEEELEKLLSKIEKESDSNENLRIHQMFGNFLTSDKNEHKITISHAEGYEFIKVSGILYIRADRSYSQVYLHDGTVMTASRNLRSFETILESYGFFRIHNSTLINIKHIKRVSRASRGTVVMEDDQDFHISLARKDRFFDLLKLT